MSTNRKSTKKFSKFKDVFLEEEEEEEELCFFLMIDYAKSVHSQGRTRSKSQKSVL